MRGIRPWLLISILVLLGSSLVAAGCGDDATTGGGGPDTSAWGSTDFTTISEGTLTIGTDAPYPPFEIGTPNDADFSGFDIDLGREIADRLALTPEFVDTS